MNDLPDIFSRSKSQSLPPSKPGGPFSLNLRSTHFNPKPQPSPIRKTFLSSDSKRYKSWYDGDRSFRETKRSSRSFFYKEPLSKEKVIDERGHSYNNINSQQTQQSDLENISNFNTIKKAAFDNTHLILRTIEIMAIEEDKIGNELNTLSQNITQQLEIFQTQFQQKLASLLKNFREERRGCLTQQKTITQQLGYLADDMGTSQHLVEELELTYSRLTAQFH